MPKFPPEGIFCTFLYHRRDGIKIGNSRKRDIFVKIIYSTSMMYRLYGVFLVVVVGFLLVYHPLISKGQKVSDEPQSVSQGSYVQGEVLVKFKPKTPKRIILKLKESLEVKEESYVSSIDLYHWKGKFDTDTAIATLKKSKHVLYAEPNYEVKTQKPSVPTVP